MSASVDPAADGTDRGSLGELLEYWRPEEHEELADLIATLAREFFIDTSALEHPGYAASR